MLKPRTAEELLVFCRRKLGLEFPSDPPAFPRSKAGGTGKDNGGAGEIRSTSSTRRGSRSRNGPEARSARKEGSGSSNSVRRVRPRADDSTIAVDVARAVLAWGQPFRNVETGWTAAAAGQSYSVLSPLPRPLPRVSTLVLCSTREVQRGEPNPLLRPGTVGPPLAVDVTVQDVRWLKDLWDTK